jgi:hypothetical protein
MERLAQHEEKMAYFLQSREGAVLLRQVNTPYLTAVTSLGSFMQVTWRINKQVGNHRKA